jgi:hypothetical protein
MQPAADMGKWKARGINTMLGQETQGNSVSFSAWRAELEAQNMVAIREPVGNIIEDAKDPRLLAWMVHSDEPDLRVKDGLLPGSQPADLQAKYAQLKTVAPKLPVLVNLAGGLITKADTVVRPTIADYLGFTKAADWISMDLYPITGWGQWIPISTIGVILDKLTGWSGGKPVFSVIEASNQNLLWVQADRRRAATPGEFRAMVWHSIIHGARGVFYFPQQIGGFFIYDNMPADLIAEMKTQNANLIGYSEMLLSPGRQLTGLPKGFEGARREYGGKVYLIILNLTDQPAVYSNGSSFTPYEYKVITQ